MCTRTCHHVAFRDPVPCRCLAVLREHWASPPSWGLGGGLLLWLGPSVCLLHSREPAALGIPSQSALAILSRRPPGEGSERVVPGAQGCQLDQTAPLASSWGRRPHRGSSGLYWVLDLLTQGREGEGRGPLQTCTCCLGTCGPRVLNGGRGVGSR